MTNTYPADRSTDVGNTTTFSVSGHVNGNPTPSLQWERSTNNGGAWSSISGAITSSYTTPTSALGHNGYLFRCVATNSVTSNVRSRSAKLTVSGTAPSFTNGYPQNRTVILGQRATFTVAGQVTGNPTPNLQWKTSTNNGTSWVNATGSSTNSEYQTVSTNIGHNDDLFRCVASNGVGGTVNSRSANLEVTENKPVISTNPATQTVTLNSNVTLTVSATGTNRQYQWQYRTSSSGNFTSISSSNSSTYEFLAEKTYNDRNYRCRVYNSGGSAYSNPAIITVHWAPTISTNLSTTTIAPIDGALTLSVSVTKGNPSSTTYKWFKNGNSYSGISNSITINNITLDFDEDVYTVEVSNGISPDASSSTKLNVKLVDSRDGQSYELVKIGNQIWTSQNINYDIGDGTMVHPGGHPNYGIFYPGHRNIEPCPPGWTHGTKEEWNILKTWVQNNNYTGDDLKGGNWTGAGTVTGQLGFNALSTGKYYGSWQEEGEGTWIMTSTIITLAPKIGGQYVLSLDNDNSNMDLTTPSTSSVLKAVARCLKKP